MTVDLRYPIGPFDDRAPIAPDIREPAITALAELPSRLTAAVAGLSDEQLDTPYRPGGWTVRQLVHHVADSHMNAYVRTKLGLTEQAPTITPYDQNAWALLTDSRLPVDVSLMILRGTRPLDRTVAIARAPPIRADLPSSGEWSGLARLSAAALRVAFPPSRRSHHGAPAPRRVARQAVACAAFHTPGVRLKPDTTYNWKTAKVGSPRTIACATSVFRSERRL